MEGCPTWDILIPSIAHRTERLTLLLAELERQRIDGLGVRVFRDNIEHKQAAKCQALLESSRADYVCFIEDDDWIAPNYVERIYHELATHRPDYIGFRLHYTESGVFQVPVVHSLAVEHNEFLPGTKELYRKVTHLNPIRRDVALTATFSGNAEMDRVWSQQIIAGGLLHTERYIDEEMYFYRRDANDSIQEVVAFTPVENPAPHPDFPWVVWL